MSDPSGMTRWLSEPPPLPRAARVIILITMHLVMFVAAFIGAFLIRFDFNVPDAWTSALLRGLPLFVGIKLAVFGVMRMYQGWWRYVSLYDIVALGRALAVAVTVTVFTVVFTRITPMPRSIFVLDFGLSLVLIGATRGGLRLLREAANQHFGPAPAELHNVLILGAGDTGETLLREISKNRNLPYRPVGFLDDDVHKQGLRIHTLPVLGRIEALPEIARKREVGMAIIAMPSASREQLRHVLEVAREAGVKTKILPAVESILEQDLSVAQLREVSISDLLRRAPVVLDPSTLDRFLQGKVVMVTGAGGSIGSELCRQVLRFGPSKLLMVERAETPLFFIHRELRAEHEDQVVECIADITDRERMDELFRAWRPEVVFHAAAYKHVPMMEANPCEAVKNNVVGTQNVADLALEYGVSDFVLISTDKAVNPTSVMGATKRVTELYIQSLQPRARERGTKLCAVRFGNVLGSNGSVVPIFRDQIRSGGPVTVTHPDMTRFFMTIPEASQLVLQAGALGSGGEIFILDMGEPVKIADLARDMIRLSGLSEEEIEIVYTGIRPGEKLYEELAVDGEAMDRTTHDQIFVARDDEGLPVELERLYRALVGSALEAQPLEVRRHLKRLIPTYKHPEVPDNVVTLDTGQHRQVPRAKDSGDTSAS